MPDAQDDRVGALHDDALPHVVDAGVSRRFMPRASWLLIVFTESDGVAMKKSRSGIVRPPSCRRPRRCRGCLSAPRARGRGTALPVDEQVRLLTADGRRLEGRVGRVRNSDGAPSTPAKTWSQRRSTSRRSGCCGSATAAGAVDDERELRVGDEAAAGELRPGRAVVHEREVGAADVETAHRHGLRDRPEVCRGATAVLVEAVDVQRQVGQRAPEIDQGDAVARARSRGSGCRPRSCR